MLQQFRFLALVAVLAMSLAACAGDDDNDDDPTATPESAAPTEAVDEPDPTATEEAATATEEPTAETEPTEEPTQEPTEDPATGTEEPTGEPGDDVFATPAGEQLQWVIEAINSEDPFSEEEYSERFTEQFVSMVPFTQIVAGMAQIASEFGEVTFADFVEPPTETQMVARLEGAEGEAVLVAVMVEPQEPYRIDYLQILPESSLDTTPEELGSWDEMDALLAELDAEASFHVAEVGDDGTLAPIHTINADERMAIGSAFKLYILGELARQVEEGIVSWDDELEIRDEWKSLPSGTMQDEPAGTSFTLRHYAEQMISISDNTATDHLLFHLGRENVEAFQAEMGHGDPSVNTPMLSTREMFALKLAVDDEQRQAYIDAVPEERRQILNDQISQTEVTIEDGEDWTGPVAIDSIEWFASTSELSAAMAALRQMSEREGLEPLGEILSINPGIELNPEAWTFVGFKGGSEPGVLNLSWVLDREDGRRFTLVVTLNDDETLIDNAAVLRIIGGAAILLESQP